LWISHGFFTVYARKNDQYEVTINFWLGVYDIMKELYIICPNRSHMKWQIASASSQQELYELWHNDKKLLSLHVHPFTNSARVEYEAEKRLFMIRKEGFRRNKTVLRNEYGVRMGQLGYDKTNTTEGNIELNGEKFFYTIQTKPADELVIYKDTKEKPFLVCGLKVNDGNTSVRFNRSTELNPTEHFLLMAVCWYMFLPVARENLVETVS